MGTASSDVNKEISHWFRGIGFNTALLFLEIRRETKQFATVGGE